MSKKIVLFIGIIAVAVIGIIVLNDVQQESAVIDYEGQPFMGDESAPVSIVEFGDYKCPHCQDFNDNMVPIIHEELVKTGKAKFYFMNYPVIGPDSTSSAQFAETVYQELGNDIFWEFHQLLFDNQTTKTGQTNLFTDELMKDILAEVASPEETEQAMLAYSEGKWEAAFKKDVSTANRLGVTSTPTIYIDGKQFEGASMSDFIKAVEKAGSSGE
ncbi:MULTISPECIES: DsbA family protein [Sporosarcina]|uniref:DsbA family protein n=1 Tax=Sporosarcina TaxID=1569 RepID=UPI00129BC249|nr:MULTISPECIES: thioredoxin domain-containing protein [unclassified Sporosarcina]GKV66511.1 disulfide bond formation protein D [Sporosarcina sp. NCCP-2331]GLB56788.1 disulfide bond formation protein D [Sporosarcina sp. NCCP-2378]